MVTVITDKKMNNPRTDKPIATAPPTDYISIKDCICYETWWSYLPELRRVLSLGPMKNCILSFSMNMYVQKCVYNNTSDFQCCNTKVKAHRAADITDIVPSIVQLYFSNLQFTTEVISQNDPDTRGQCFLIKWLPILEPGDIRYGTADPLTHSSCVITFIRIAISEHQVSHNRCSNCNYCGREEHLFVVIIL